MSSVGAPIRSLTVRLAQRREIEIGVLGRDLGAVAGIGRAEREISHIE